MKYFDSKNNRLVFIQKSATPDFWDSHWNSNDFKKSVLKGSENKFIFNITKKFLKPGSKIIEGGCGNGHFVYSLHKNGYQTIGIDFACDTIKKIKKEFPELNVITGDVREIPFPDEYFDGYWSIGVIEHFYEGYEKIIKEAQRILKKGGFLFLTFPQLSIMRKIKSKMGLYKDFESKSVDLSKFYQFAFDHKKIKENIKKHGFVLVKRKSIAGLKGIKDEIYFFKKPLQKIYDSKLFIFRILKVALSLLFEPFFGHSALMVFRKK